MVDPTQGIGNIQSIQSRASERRTDDTREKRQTERQEDTVEVSEDAKVLSTLPETRELVANSDLPLGLDRDFAQREQN